MSNASSRSRDFFFLLGRGGSCSSSKEGGSKTLLKLLALLHAQIVGVTRHRTIMCAAHMERIMHRIAIITKAHAGVSLPASSASSILSIASLTMCDELTITAVCTPKETRSQLARVGAHVVGAQNLRPYAHWTRLASHIQRVLQVGMSTTKKTTKKPRPAPVSTVEAGGMLDNCCELAGFIADGLLEFVKDSSCAGDTRRDCPVAYKGKGGMLCAARLLNKEIRSELDKRIKALIVDIRDKIMAYREAHLQSMGSWTLQENRRVLPDNVKQLIETRRSELSAATLPVFGENVTLKIMSDVCGEGHTVHLEPDVGTFMAMVTQRCQIHGALRPPESGQRCRNLCNTMNNDNFSIIRVGEYKRCVFARERCLDSQCINMNPRFLTHGESNIPCNTARAMFRMKGVMPPYDPRKVCEAVNYWGVAVDRSRGQAPTSQDWPRKIFLVDHPLVKGEYSSVQSALNMSDTEVKMCRDDALRKHQQKKDREKALVEMSVKDLMEDLDSELKRIKIPIKSVKKMKEDYPAIYTAIEVAVRKNHSARHVMEIDMVVNSLDTIAFMLGDVVDAEVELGGSVSSCEAYEFVSGMHVGRYEKVSPQWAYHYGTLNRGFLFKRHERETQDIIKALAIFDAMDKSSLLVNKTRDHDHIPTCFSICTSQGSFTFDARWYSWDETVALHNDIKELMAREDNENELPDLYPKRVHTDVTNYVLAGDKQSREFRNYVINMFKATVDDYGTRCAALDILHLTPERMVQIIAEKRSPPEADVPMTRSSSSLSFSE